MHSGKGWLSIDGGKPISVEYHLAEDGLGQLTGDRTHMVRAHLGYSVELATDELPPFRLIVDSIGALGGGKFHLAPSRVV